MLSAAAPRTKRLSCQRCQARKLKCSRTEPCSSCTSARQTCQFREQDVKRRPATHEYVAALENRVAWLESSIEAIKHADPGQRDVLLDTLVVRESAKSTVETIDATSLLSTSTRQPRLQVGAEGSLIYHGPTSIYQTQDADDVAAIETSYLPSSSSTQVAQHFGLREDLITSGLQSFFKWHYPHLMFIYREAFLHDYYNNTYHGRYQSPPLVYAICALGALMAADQNFEPGVGERFSAAAESILMVSGLDRPCITTVQAFLCMAFYEIGKGHLSKGWAYSGIAFRMGYDIGLHRDPSFWNSQTISGSPEDTEIRRRIYWGCYLSDKIISLMLGRAVSLQDADAIVGPIVKMPDFPDMVLWLPAGLGDIEDNINIQSPSVLRSFQAHLKLAQILQTILAKFFATSGTSVDIGKLWQDQQSRLDALNVDLGRWQEDLPEPLKWNKWEPTTTLLVPHVAAMHILFNSARLCLNLDFAVASTDSFATSKAICESSAENIIALVRKFKVQYGLTNAPLIFVYGIVQAANAVTSMERHSSQSLFHTAPSVCSLFKTQYEFLISALDECSATWPLARSARKTLVRSIDGLASISPVSSGGAEAFDIGAYENLDRAREVHPNESNFTEMFSLSFNANAA